MRRLGAQVAGKGGSFAHHAVHFEVAAHLAGDAARDGEADSEAGES